MPEAEEIIGKYFPALDYGFVALVDYMGTDISIERSARVSYGVGTRKKSDTRNLIRYLDRHRHSSPTEFVELTFHIGLPIFVMRQHIRHRMSSTNEYSGRYSIMPLMFYTPGNEDVCKQSKTNKQGSDGSITQEEYRDFLQDLREARHFAKENYKSWVGDDIAREMARIDLPLSTYTFAYWKIDLRNLFHYIGLRSDPHAQKQIRVYSDIFAGIAKRVAPLAFEAFQDYQLGAITFNQNELSLILELASMGRLKSYWNGEVKAIRDGNKEIAKKHGIIGRELDEFWSKLELKEKRSFDLDLSSAKDGSFYEALMAEHAVEIPA